MVEHLLGDKIAKLEIELAQYKVAYHNCIEENKTLKELKEIVDSSKELQELIEEIKNKGEQK